MNLEASKDPTTRSLKSQDGNDPTGFQAAIMGTCAPNKGGELATARLDAA